MTDILFNTSLTVNAYLNPCGAPNRGIEGMAMQIGQGILGLYTSQLPAGPLAMPALHSLVNITAGMILQAQAQGQAEGQFALQGEALASFEPVQQWTATMQGQDKASVDLGDGYSLQIDENNSEVVITNAETGETTRIWGDPHVDVDGKHVYDFWGTTTFTLENGTKITIDTEAAADNPNVYYAEKLTITKGDQALVVDGVSQLTKGDLSVSMSNNGEFLDAVTRDGFVLNENDSGSGWRSELTGEVATQADLNLTRPGQIYGPGSEMPSFGELNQTLSTFLFMGIVGSMIDGGSSVSARAYVNPFAGEA